MTGIRRLKNRVRGALCAVVALLAPFAELSRLEGDAALLPQADVGISANGDGTATMTVPRAADAPRMFCQVVAP